MMHNPFCILESSLLLQHQFSAQKQTFHLVLNLVNLLSGVFIYVVNGSSGANIYYGCGIPLFPLLCVPCLYNTHGFDVSDLHLIELSYHPDV